MRGMRAAVAGRPDGPDGLVVRELPTPDPRPGWALVKVEAFGLNRFEYMTLRGWSGDTVTFPRVLGIKCVRNRRGRGGGSDGEAGDDRRRCDGRHGPRVRRRMAEYAVLPGPQLISLDTG
jgi:hypothetical protein